MTSLDERYAGPRVQVTRADGTSYEHRVAAPPRSHPVVVSIPREFDRIEWDDKAQPIVNARIAEALVNDRRHRHPDGMLWLSPPRQPGVAPVESLVLVPVFSPRTHRWCVFKCERAPGRKFRLHPLEVVQVTSGTTWMFQNPCDNEVITGENWDAVDADGIFHVDEAFEHAMAEAWEAALAWQAELRSAWSLDCDVVDPWAADEIAFSNEFVETVAIVQEMHLRKRVLDAGDE